MKTTGAGQRGHEAGHLEGNMNEQYKAELTNRIEKAERKQIFTRYCMEPDLQGFREILLKNDEICSVEIAKRPFGNGCDEYFFTILNDEKLKKEARNVLLLNFCKDKS